jgi:hypothetical protein
MIDFYFESFFAVRIDLVNTTFLATTLKDFCTVLGDLKQESKYLLI